MTKKSIENEAPAPKKKRKSAPPRKNNSKTKRVHDATIIKAIEGSGGIISTIAERLKVNWRIAKEMVNRNDIVSGAYDDESQRMLDVGESVLMNLVAEGDPLMLKFYLERKGKSRGYGANMDLTSKGERLPEGATTVVKYGVIELPDHLKPKPETP